MKPSKIIIIILVIVLFTASCSSEKEEQQASAEINLRLLSITTQLSSLKGDINVLQNQLEDIEDSIGEKPDEDRNLAAINELMDKANENKEAISDINDLIREISENSNKIILLEKELIKQTSGAYDNYNFYYYDEGNYSVRFSKDYLYRITEPPEGTSPDGVGGALTIFFDKTNNESITLFPWHSRGVSTTMKSIPVKNMYTDEGEVIEYVEYEIDGINYMDFGFVDYFLKISCHFNKDNTMYARKKVMDIVKTIMFYEFNFAIYYYQK